MNKPITLTKEDAEKLTKAAGLMAEGFQQMADAAKDAAKIFEKFAATAEQLEFPEAEPDYCEKCGIIQTPGVPCRECNPEQ